MARRGDEEAYPLVHRTVSDESFTSFHEGRLSPVSVFSDYDPYSRSSSSQAYVPSSHTSTSDIQSRHLEDDFDGNSFRRTPTGEWPANQNNRFSAASARLPDSLRAGPPPSPSAAYNSNRFSWNSTETGGSASPIEKLADGARNLAGRMRSFRNPGMRRAPSHQPIPEGDEFDMGLVKSPTGVGAAGRNSWGMGGAQDEEAAFDVDISSFTGPMSSEEISAFQERESEGHLTGGLGTGFKVDARISSRDLYSSAANSPVEVSRKLSKLDSSVSRASTLRYLGQREANRRGQVIEVIVEEEEHAQQVDLSSFGGENTPEHETDPAGQLRRTGPLKIVETYYPQGNWKPVSMRWPYLVALITISITLAAAQEYLYQKSAGKLTEKLGLFTFQTPEEVTTFDYFTFKYAPTMIAVTYGVLWQFTDFEVKRLEAYYQLSKEGGASAEESMNVDYITVFNLWRPFRAIRYRHWAVAISSVATIFAVSLVPTLQVTSVVVQSQDGLKLVVIDQLWSRILTVLLIVIAILGCLLLWHLQSRHSGLVADVKGIAGIAAMATKSHVLMDFKNLDKYPPKAIHDKLKDRRYMLRNSSLVACDTSKFLNTSEPDLDYDDTARNPHPLMLQPLFNIPFIIAMALFTAFLPIVLFVSAARTIPTTQPWLLTLLAVLIKMGFQTLEQDVRMLEPYYILSCRHAHPRVLTLDYTSMAFLHMPIRAFLNGHYLTALVGFGSVFAEILTVCVTSFAGITGVDFLRQDAPDDSDRGDLTPMSFWVSFSLSMAIMVYLLLLTSLTILLRRHPFLPRQPSTIASVLAYIHQSKMLVDFIGYEHDNELMVRNLAEQKLQFGLGWFRGRDNFTHCGVDKEELIATYTHEKARDMRRAVMEGGENWEVF